MATPSPTTTTPSSTATTSFRTCQTPHQEISLCSRLDTCGPGVSHAPKIDHLHATVLTAPIGCVIGRNGLGRTIANRKYALRGEVEVLDEVGLDILDTLF